MPPQDRRSVYDLVSFAQPPVAEVALTVQFDAETVDIEAFGLFAHELREQFPVRQRQPVLPAISETFDELAGMPSFNIQFTDPASLPRLWLISKDGTELVQLQHDRLSYNWRRLDENTRYPRYAHLRKRLSRLLEVLSECVDTASRAGDGGRKPTVNLCEVVYVNPVEFAAGDSPSKEHPDLSRIIARLRPPPKGAFLPNTEDTQLQARWRIPSSALGRTGGPVGRLHLAVVPALKPPLQTPIYMMNLTARVFPASPTQRNVMKALDAGHEYAVLAFTEVTTKEAQQYWGIMEDGSK